MKKIVTLLAFTCISLAGISQELGARFGDALGNAVAIDAVFNTGKFNRIHADVSFGSGVGIEVLWDFINRPLGGEAFNWYAGAGVSTRLDDPFTLGVSGEIGLEYRFNTVPIALGLDWRPVFILVENTDFDAGGFGFNARFIFGK
ncbi:MAG: outer membrane insertion C- signal [Flammeovirgaceae bacterium]|nr:outer membrane insertion C- signal [Flammeovirgaceae bacterium]